MNLYNRRQIYLAIKIRSIELGGGNPSEIEQLEEEFRRLQDLDRLQMQRKMYRMLNGVAKKVNWAKEGF